MDQPSHQEAGDGTHDSVDDGRGAAAEQTVRLAKLQALREAGIDPYPYRFDRSHTLAEVRATHGALEPGAETVERVAVAGRLMLIRRQGKLTFASLRDRTGELQLFVSRSVVGAPAHEAFDALDRGDWIGVEGTVMVTRKGELSVKVDRFELLAKALRPLPEKWKGLTDTDTRYRQRYTDLIVNDDARRVFEVRHALVSSFRRTLSEHDFVEVETPILHVEAGGAHARPFVTHHNSLHLDLYLRIALELHLKRLIVGGMERVFEIGRVFRNEGLSTRRNPEFTMLELYQAFGDYSDVMAITETLLVQAARDTLGTAVVPIGGVDVDLTAPWRSARMVDLASEAVGEEVHPSQPVDRLRDIADAHGVSWLPHWGSGKIIEELFEALAEDGLAGPVFVTGHPLEISPLARVDRTDPFLTERFELYLGGIELANGYSELNDPVEQRHRFGEEQRAKEAGDLEAGTVDEDYLRALEYGMPPTGGLGIGIDRVAMLLAGVGSIKEVILFPTLRPEAGLESRSGIADVDD